MYILATIRYKLKDLGVVGESLVIIVTVLASVVSSVSRGPTLTTYYVVKIKEY